MRHCEARTPPDLVLESSDLTGSRIPIILWGSEAPIEVFGTSTGPANVLRKDLPPRKHVRRKLDLDEPDLETHDRDGYLPDADGSWTDSEIF